MIRRKLSHTRQASKSYHFSFLYSILHSIGIEHFTFLCTPIPHYLRKPLEHQLISWFKPSLNILHNSNFKSDIYSNPSIPDILKSALQSLPSSLQTLICFLRITSTAQTSRHQLHSVIKSKDKE